MKKISIKAQYDRAVEAYKICPGSIYWPLADIEARLTYKQRKYIEKNNAQLVLTPPLNLYELIIQFDKKQEIDTYIYHDLWDQYKFAQEMRVDFVLPELMFTNQTYEEQRLSLKVAQKSIKGLQSIDPRTYIMLNVIRRQNGEDLLDTTTFTRFIQLGRKTVGRDSWVGDVDSDGDQLGLDGTRGYALSSVGVGLSVGLDLKSSASATASFPSFSTSTPGVEHSSDLQATIQANTEALKELTTEIRKKK